MNRPIFNEAAHTYTLGGVQLPSVTRILEPMYDFRFVKEEHLERARKLGSAVDKTVELYVNGKLDEGRTSPTLLKYLRQWQDFCRTMKYTPRRDQELVWCEKDGYAGTYDTDGLMNSMDEWIIDRKTGGTYPAHELQTAAYKRAAVKLGLLKPEAQRGSVYLTETSWDFKMHKDQGDEIVFLSLLNVYKWKARHVR